MGLRGKDKNHLHTSIEMPPSLPSLPPCFIKINNRIVNSNDIASIVMHEKDKDVRVEFNAPNRDYFWIKFASSDETLKHFNSIFEQLEKCRKEALS